MPATRSDAREMAGTDVPRAGRPHARPSYLPRVQAAVPRPALLARIPPPDGSVVVLVAPAGYGKSTLLSDLAAREGNAAHLRLEHAHDDPVVLLGDLVAALERLAPQDADLPLLIRSPNRSVEGSLLPRVTEALWQLPPGVLMVDDVMAVTDRRSLDVLTTLALRLPPQLQLVLASRKAPDLAIARLRAEGRLRELHADDLAFSDADVTALAAQLGVPVTAGQRAELLEATEGWPAAVYLGLLALRDDVGRGRQPISGRHGSVREYMRQELLDPLPPDLQAWLLRSSVLPTLTAALCDAALETTGSHGRLRHLERVNGFTIPLDEAGVRYRYHRLFSEFLQDELAVREPEAADAIRRRAAVHLAEAGSLAPAVELAHEAGDMALVARLVAAGTFPLAWQGRMATLERWLGWFDTDELRSRWSITAGLSAVYHAFNGDLAKASRWLPIAEAAAADPASIHLQDPHILIGIARGLMVPDGVDGAVADAAAMPPLRGPSPLRVASYILPMSAALLTGDLAGAEAWAREAILVEDRAVSRPGVSAMLGVAASLALHRGDPETAAADIREALAVIAEGNLETYLTSTLPHAVAARLAILGGDPAEARRHLARFEQIRPRSTAAMPMVSILARLEVIRTLAALQDAASARTHLVEVRDILRVRPRMGWLVGQVAEVAESVDRLRGRGSGGAWTLTSAELRLLAFLPTHLTFREVADRLGVSRHTVKTQALSIYSKLGASTRGEAIELAVEHGLLDPAIVRVPGVGRTHGEA